MPDRSSTHINGHLRQKGKIAELALGYGGSVGALKSMGALDMGLEEEELQPLVNAWRKSNPNIVRFWWDVDAAVKKALKEKQPQVVRGVKFFYESGMLFIHLPSGRTSSYVKPRMGENRFGGESVTYEGVGSTKKWERIESYGPKFVENIVQATSRDILMYAMMTLRCCSIVAHVHDEIIVEADPKMSLEVLCQQMGDDFYPQIIDKETFQAAETERKRREKALGRDKIPKKEKPTPLVFKQFSVGTIRTKFSDPIRQAEYAYSQVKGVGI